jgi:hypothetical protein
MAWDAKLTLLCGLQLCGYAAFHVSILVVFESTDFRAEFPLVELYVGDTTFILQHVIISGFSMSARLRKDKKSMFCSHLISSHA